MSPSLLYLLVFKNLQRFLKDLTSFRCQDGYQIAGDRKSIVNIWYYKFKFYWGVIIHNNVAQQAVVNKNRTRRVVEIIIFRMWRHWWVHRGCNKMSQTCNLYKFCGNYNYYNYNFGNEKFQRFPPFLLISLYFEIKLSFQGNIFLSLQTWVYRRW